MTNRFSNNLIAIAVPLSVGVLLSYTWVLTGFGKLFGGGVPQGFIERFKDTFLASFPGISISFWSIAILECVAAVVSVAAVLRGEWLPGRDKTITYVALVLTLLLFLQLGFGLRVAGDNAGAASLWFYYGTSIAALIGVHWSDRLGQEARRPVA